MPPPGRHVEVVQRFVANGELPAGHADQMALAGQVPRDPDLEHAPKFDLSMKPATAAFQAFVTDRLVPEVLDTQPCARARATGLAVALGVVVANLVHTSNAFSRTRYTAFQRANGAIRATSRYNRTRVGQSVFIQAIDGLRELGYVEYRPGFQDRETGNRYWSRIRLGVDFALRLARELGPNLVVDHAFEIEPIRLKDADRIIEYEDNLITRTMREELVRYNGLLADHHIEVDGSEIVRRWVAEQRLQGQPVDFTRSRYHRVFNRGSFELGGRYYGPWWVSAPSRVRTHIQIDGQPVVCRDCQAMNIHLAYGMAGLSFWDVHGAHTDPYHLPGYDHIDRTVRKWAALFALSCKSQTKATGALIGKAEETGHPVERAMAKELIAAVQERHAQIAQLMLADRALDLTRCESRITEQVIRRSIADQIPVLNVHDEYITIERHRDHLTNMIEEGFREVGFLSIPNLH